MHISVRDFQSITHSEVTVEGFAVLIGRSNIGKSALVRAVHAALTNPTGTAFVRHGATCARLLKDQKTCKCFCQVHLVGKGFDILWEKGDAVSRYTVNGAVYDKIDRGIPPFLAPLGFAPIRVGDDSVSLHVSGQWKPIFLLDRKGSEIAELVSDVGKLDKINEAIRYAEKDRREAQSTRKVREGDVKQLEAALVRFENLDAGLAQAERAEALGDELAQAEANVKLLRRANARHDVLAAELGVVRLRAEAPVPDLAPVTEVDARRRRLGGWLIAEEILTGYIAKRVERDAVPVPGLEGVEAATAKVVRHQGWLGKLRALKGPLDAGKAAASVVVPDLAVLTVQAARAETMRSYINKLLVLGRGLKAAQVALEATEAEEKALLDERDALGDVCPTCDRPLHAEGH